MKLTYKSYFVAYLLLFFLGLIGAHRFYVGRTGSGLLYFFTLGISLFGWLFDFFYTYKMVADYNKEVDITLKMVNK